MSVLLVVLVSGNLVSLPGKESTKREDVYPNVIPLRNSLSEYPEMEAFDKSINNFLKKWQIKGASIALVKDEKLVYAKGYGFADEENKELVQPNNLFRIASVSKLVTSVAIMKLVEENKLSLDDTVFGENGILNDTSFLTILDNKVKTVTVRNLLSHSGGWSNRYGDIMFVPLAIAERMNVPSPPDINTIIKFVLKYRRLSFIPGTRSCYSNFGYAVLGKIIEIKTSMNYELYIQESILRPLGIYGMRLGGNTLQERYFAEVKYYEPWDAPLKESIYGDGIKVQRSYGGNDIKGLGGAGGWIASSVDLMKLIVSIDGNSLKSDLLSYNSIQTMTYKDDHIDPFGWKYIDPNYWCRTGSFPGTSAIVVKQNDNISWVVLLNTNTWKGCDFTVYIRNEMTKALQLVTNWPQYDLFEYGNIAPLISIKLSDFAMSTNTSSIPLKINYCN